MFLKLRNDRLLKYAPVTSLSNDSVATDTTSDVLSISLFTGSNKYVLFGNFGDEQAELVSFTSSTGSTLTHAALTKDHPAGTPVYLLNANQVQFMRATTVSGTYAELGKVTIMAESLVTIYEDTTNTTGFGKARFWNSGSSAAYGDYWEIIKYDEDVRKTRGFVKRVACSRQNVSVDGDPDITEDFLNDAITECDDRIREEKINWKEEVGELVIETAIGQTEYDISSYFKEQLTASSILYAKCDGEEIAVRTYDNFLSELGNAVKTELAADVALVDVTITVVDSSDLPDEGSIMIGDDSIDYTDNDRTTNILSGVTGITSTHTTGDEVWYDPETGTPDMVSVSEGVLYAYPLISDDASTKTIRIIYSKQYTNITLDSDELAFPSFLYIDFLRAAIASKKGEKDAQVLERRFDVDLLKYKSKDTSPVETGFKPATMLYPSSRRRSLP